MDGPLAAGPPNTSILQKSMSRRLADSINELLPAGLIKGSRVWVKAGGKSEWEIGELRGFNAYEAQVALDSSGKVVHVRLTRDNPSLVPANPDSLDSKPDLTHLSHLNEPALLHHLLKRYQRDEIYTFAGTVLVACNPFKSLDLYTPEIAEMYKAETAEAANTPHIYLVAANAFRQMQVQNKSQSLIVNGESGAGKTETTKKAMQYFAKLSGGTSRAGAGRGTVEDQVLETNPILEAFGNSKTLRNNNSSRFGKLIQIHFNQKYHICGATIKTYLLEKSRVVNQLKGERSYHIFYQLIRGADPALKQELGLPDHPTAFKYLAGSGCTEVDGMDDAKEFKDMTDALDKIGIEAAEKHALFRLLAAVLWLGNVTIVEDPSGDDASKLVVDAACTQACTLLGVTAEALNRALTIKQLTIAGQLIPKNLKAPEANDARDALAKALFASCFNWLVGRINNKLGGSQQAGNLSIAILDIYGFEHFQTNSFEQMCINYANERLQHQFTNNQVDQQQQEYQNEGIDWTKVEFIDNFACVEVFELMPPNGVGVLAHLDSQCKTPQANDDTFVRTLKESLGRCSHFASNPRKPDEFTILHYAGEVSYNSKGFLEKNKDTLNADLIELMLGADPADSLVPSLGQAIKEQSPAQGPSTGQARASQTVGGRFSQQLRELIRELDTTGLHFVRCIKPNGVLRPDTWDEEMVLQQLRCCGVLEVARIARAGYPTRYTHQEFAGRYGVLLPPDKQNILMRSTSLRIPEDGTLETSKALDACHQLLDVFGLYEDQYQVGYTKIFFRPGVLTVLEDKWRAMQRGAVTIQKNWRMYVDRKAYSIQRNAATIIAASWKARQERLNFYTLIQKTRAAKVIQRNWRAYYKRTRLHGVVASAVRIQMMWRRYLFNRRVAKRSVVRLQREAEERAKQNKFDTLREEYGCDMDDVRAALAAWAGARDAAAGGGGQAELSQAMTQALASRGIVLPVDTEAAAAAEALQAELEAAEAKIAELEACNLANDNQLADLSSQVTGLAAELAARDEALSKVQAEVASKDEALAKLQAEMAALGQQLAAKDQMVSTLNTQVSESAAKVAQQEGLVSSLNEQLADATTKVQAGSVALAALTAEVAQLTGVVSERDGSLASLNAQLAELTAQLQSKDAEVADQAAKLASKESELAEQGAKLSGKETELAQLMAMVSGKESELSDLAPRLATKEAELVELAARFATKEGEAADLVSKLAAKDAELANMAGLLASKDEQASSRSTETAELSKKLASQEAAVASLNAQLSEAGAKLAAKEQELAAAATQVSGRDDQLAQLSAELSQIKSDRDALQVTAATLTAQAQQPQANPADVERLEKENSHLKKKWELEEKLKTTFQTNKELIERKYTEHMEAVKEYIEAVRTVVSDRRLPSLPAVLINATGLPMEHEVTIPTPTAAARSVDAAALERAGQAAVEAAARNNGAGEPGPSRPSLGQMHGDLASSRRPLAKAIKVVPGRYGLQSAAEVQAPAVREVNDLKEDFAKGDSDLNADMDRLDDVLSGRVRGNATPLQEYNLLKKKLEIWTDAFKKKLAVAESKIQQRGA